MDLSPRVSFEIQAINLPSCVRRRISTVLVRVERTVNQYIYSTPNTRPLLSSSKQKSSFTIDSSTTFSQIFEFLHNQHYLNSQLCRTLASQVIQKADDMNVGRIAILMSVRVKISRDALVSILDWDGGDKKDADELGLDKEGCSICLENLLQQSEKIPMRMPCSHLFHRHCILQWLGRNNSCPVCRQVFYER